MEKIHGGLPFYRIVQPVLLYCRQQPALKITRHTVEQIFGKIALISKIFVLYWEQTFEQ